MTRWLVASGISALLLAGPALAQDSALLTVKPAPAPVLDGAIGEEEWAEAAREGGPGAEDVRAAPRARRTRSSWV